MPTLLRQSTSQTIRFGPFLDSTDGVTAETALTVAQADRQVSKDGGAFAQSNHTGNSTHDTDGWYSDDLDATDTNTLGILLLQIVVSGALPVWHEFMVVPAVVYDTLVLGTDDLNAQVAGMDADVITAAAIAANAIGSSELATDAVEEIADQVWDEVLTGATHNVVNSAGRRLRQLQEAGTYAGAVWIDTVNGTAGTTSFENGTDTNPVDNIAHANTLATNLGLSRFMVAPGSSITFAASQQNQKFMGMGWALALGGQDIDGITVIGATVSGVGTNATGVQRFIDCHMNACTLPQNTHWLSCHIAGTQTLGEAGDYFLDQCFSAVAGTSTPVLDFGALLNASNVSVRHYSGGIEIQNMGAGTGSYNMSLEGHGQLVINANCSATSTVAIRGNFTVTDNAGGAVTLSDDARIDVAQINAEADTALTDYGASTHSAVDVWSAVTRTLTAATNITSTGGTTVPQTGDSFARLGAPAGASVSADIASVQTDTDAIEVDTQDIQSRLPAVLVGGRMDSDVGNMQTDVISAASFSTGAAQEIRDEILPTQNAAFSNLMFLFVAASDHVTPVTGATGTAVSRSIDGAAFAAGTGTLAEIANGIYQYDASAADMNGGVITFRFSATGGTPGAPDDRFVTVITGGGV